MPMNLGTQMLWAGACWFWDWLIRVVQSLMDSDTGGWRGSKARWLWTLIFEFSVTWLVSELKNQGGTSCSAGWLYSNCRRWTICFLPFYLPSLLFNALLLLQPLKVPALGMEIAPMPIQTSKNLVIIWLSGSSGDLGAVSTRVNSYIATNIKLELLMGWWQQIHQDVKEHSKVGEVIELNNGRPYSQILTKFLFTGRWIISSKLYNRLWVSTN